MEGQDPGGSGWAREIGSVQSRQMFLFLFHVGHAGRCEENGCWESEVGVVARLDTITMVLVEDDVGG